LKIGPIINSAIKVAAEDSGLGYKIWGLSVGQKSEKGYFYFRLEQTGSYLPVAIASFFQLNCSNLYKLASLEEKFQMNREKVKVGGKSRDLGFASPRMTNMVLVQLSFWGMVERRRKRKEGESG